MKPTTQNTTDSPASVQTSRTILNIVKRDTSWTRPFRDCFTLRASRLDPSSGRVRVQVSGEKLVDQTTEMILWSMTLSFDQFEWPFMDTRPPSSLIFTVCCYCICSWSPSTASTFRTPKTKKEMSLQQSSQVLTLFKLTLSEIRTQMPNFGAELSDISDISEWDI